MPVGHKTAYFVDFKVDKKKLRGLTRFNFCVTMIRLLSPDVGFPPGQFEMTAASSFFFFFGVGYCRQKT
jgi:hypothetical protein